MRSPFIDIGGRLKPASMRAFVRLELQLREPGRRVSLASRPDLRHLGREA